MTELGRLLAEGKQIMDDYDAALTTVCALADRYRELALLYWEDSHSEHCTNMPHVEGDMCHWPLPEELK